MTLYLYQAIIILGIAIFAFPFLYRLFIHLFRALGVILKLLFIIIFKGLGYRVVYTSPKGDKKVFYLKTAKDLVEFTDDPQRFVKKRGLV